MPVEAMQGVMIPLLGTTLGSACVLFMRRALRSSVQRALTGFAAGVMVAASVWSLLLPAIEQSESMGAWSFVPAVIGFWIGILFLLMLDKTIPHLHLGSEQPEGAKVPLKKTTMLVLAVTLHNIPEGMAVGVLFAGRNLDFNFSSPNIRNRNLFYFNSLRPGQHAGFHQFHRHFAVLLSIHIFIFSIPGRQF